MAAVTQQFGSFNVGLSQGPLVVNMTYDTVTLKVTQFQVVNPGPPTDVLVTINGSTSTETAPSGTTTLPGFGITLVPSPKGGSPLFPLDISIGPA